MSAAAAALIGCGGKAAEDSEMFFDFTDSAGRWPTADDDLVLLAVADGGYRMVLRDASRPHASWLQVSEGEQALTIEAEAVLRDDPQGTESRESWGVACSSVNLSDGAEADSRPDEVTYFFHVTSDGLWAIGREDEGSASEEFVERGENALARPRETHRLTAECRADGRGEATVTVAVDGRQLGRATNLEGPMKFTTVALHMRAEAAGTGVVFDNVSIRRGATP